MSVYLFNSEGYSNLESFRSRRVILMDTKENKNSLSLRNGQLKVETLHGYTSLDLEKVLEFFQKLNADYLTIPREFEISKKSSTRNQKILDFFIENGKNLKLIQSVELFEEFEVKDEIYGYSLQLPKEYDLLDVEKFVQRVKKPVFTTCFGNFDEIENLIRVGVKEIDGVEYPFAKSVEGILFVDEGEKIPQEKNLKDPIFHGSEERFGDFTLGYLHHLLECDEILAVVLLTKHNLEIYSRFFQNLL